MTAIIYILELQEFMIGVIKIMFKSTLSICHDLSYNESLLMIHYLLSGKKYFNSMMVNAAMEKHQIFMSVVNCGELQCNL